MYTIFKNDCTFNLTDNLKFSDKPYFYYWNKIEIKTLLKDCESLRNRNFYFYHKDIQYLWKEFKSNFTLINAAGGVVFNENNDILFIHRLGKWDLPKGKIEKNEDQETAALREVKEECGIIDLELMYYITDTYHLYSENNVQFLKITSWFKMFSNSKKLTPQTEEDITKVVWKNTKAVEKALQNTYPNILRLLKILEQID